MKEKLQKWLTRAWPYLVFLIASCILLSWQFVNRAVSTSVDSYFHFSRIYDASRQLRTGNWGLLTNFAFQQSGRIVNGVYGPGLAYFLGFLALVCHSWLRLQMAFALLLYLAAACGMYLLVLRLTGQQVLSTLITLCYLAFSPLTAWPTMANFQAVSAALAPWVVLLCARLVTNRQAPLNWLSLGIFMALCAQLHMLDCLIFGSALAIFAFVGFILTDHKKALLCNLLAAIALFAVLSVNIWLPILHFTGRNAMSTPLAFDLAQHTWNLHGIYRYLGDTFTVLFVIMAVINLLYVLFHWRQSILNNVLALTGSFYLLAASSYFPWRQIQKTWPALQTSFQSPRRLTALALALLLASMALTLHQLSHRPTSRALALSALIILLASGWTHSTNLTAYYTNAAVQNTATLAAGRERDMSQLLGLITKPYPDYLPNPRHQSPQVVLWHYQKDVMLRNNNFRKKVLPHNRLQISWSAAQAGHTKLPIVMYRESRLSKPILAQSSIGTPTVRQHKGHNTAILSYDTPKSILISIYLALLAWLGLLIYGLYRWGRRLTHRA